MSVVMSSHCLDEENIKPKSIAREMFESFFSFADYVQEYDLERAEGLLLRHLNSVYKVLRQTVPDAVKADEVVEMELYLRDMLRQVDSRSIGKIKVRWRQSGASTGTCGGDGRRTFISKKGMFTNEIVVVLERPPTIVKDYDYRLLAAIREKTIHKELAALIEEGYELIAMLTFGEHVLIMERARELGAE